MISQTEFVGSIFPRNINLAFDFCSKPNTPLTFLETIRSGVSIDPYQYQLYVFCKSGTDDL